jgi:anti-sigma factor RsiW
VNPDKLFDYLDGKLSPSERTAFEQRLSSDEQLQRELAVARRIHSSMRGDSREVLLEPETEITERGRKLARRIGVAFIILMSANVGVGLWFIARHESKNPNRALLEAQMREQLAKSLEHAAAAELSPVPLGVTEIRLSAATGQSDAIANEVVALAQRLGGTATKGIPDQHRVGVLVDLPGAHEMEFRNQITAIAGIHGTPVVANESATIGSGNKSFAVEIVEQSQR